MAEGGQKAGGETRPEQTSTDQMDILYRISHHTQQWKLGGKGRRSNVAWGAGVCAQSYNVSSQVIVKHDESLLS